MALNNIRLGDAIVARIKTENATDALPTLIAADETRLKRYWRAIADEIIKEFQNNGDIQLLDSDIHIKPGTFIDSVTSAAISGQAENLPVTLVQKIK